MGRKKTKTVPFNLCPNVTVRNKKKSNSKSNYLKNISNSFNMKGKNANENNNSEKSTNFHMNFMAVLEDTRKSKLKCHGPIEKISETLDEQNKLKENPGSTANRFETKKRKKMTNRIKISSKVIQDTPTETPSKTSKKNEDESSNTKITAAEPEKKQGTETTVEKLSNLPDNNDGELIENAYFKVPGYIKTKTVSLINENSNETAQNHKKNNTKSRCLKNISNSFYVKEKDANENNSSEKSTNSHIMNCMVILEDILMKGEINYNGSVEKTSVTLDKQNKPVENLNFEIHDQIKSAENQFKNKKRKRKITTNKIKTRSTQDQPTETPNKNSKKKKYENASTKMIGSEEKQGIETTPKNSSNFSDNNEGTLTENANFGVANAEQTISEQTIATTNKKSRDRPTWIIHAYYQEP